MKPNNQLAPKARILLPVLSLDYAFDDRSAGMAKRISKFTQT